MKNAICAACVAAIVAALGSLATPLKAEFTTWGDVYPPLATGWTYLTEVYIGQTADGGLNVNTDVTCRMAYLGYEATARGYATVDGAGATWTIPENVYDPDGLRIGESGQGQLNIINGGTVNSAKAYIAMKANSLGMVTVDGEGSTWKGLQHLYVADGGHGELSIVNGGTVVSQRVRIGTYSSSVGTVTVDGEGSTWTNDILSVGDGFSVKQASLRIVNGGTVVSSQGLIAKGFNSAANVLIEGAGSSWTTEWSVTVGYEAHGTLRIADGGVLNTQAGVLARTFSSTAVVTIDGLGSMWATTSDLHMGYDGDATLTITRNAMVRVGRSLRINGGGYNGRSSVRMAANGRLALNGRADASIGDFLGLVVGHDTIQYWDGSDWAHITAATAGDDYFLTYHDTGDLAGYTVLTVTTVPEPATMTLLALGGLAVLRRRRRTGRIGVGGHNTMARS